MSDETQMVLEHLGARLTSAVTLSDLQRIAHDTAVAKGWHPEGENPDELFPRWGMLAVTEIAEAVQAHRKYESPEVVADELADVLIRLLDTAQAVGVDLETAVRIKMLVNLHREQRHGGRRY